MAGVDRRGDDDGLAEGDVVEPVDPVGGRRARRHGRAVRDDDRHDGGRSPDDVPRSGPGRILDAAECGELPLPLPAGGVGRHVDERSRPRHASGRVGRRPRGEQSRVARVDRDARVVGVQHGERVVDARFGEGGGLLTRIGAVRIARAGGRHEHHRRQRDRQDEHRDDREDQGDALLFAKKAAPRRNDAATEQSSRRHACRMAHGTRPRDALNGSFGRGYRANGARCPSVATIGPMPRDPIDRLRVEMEELFNDLWQVPRFTRRQGGFRPQIDCYSTEQPRRVPRDRRARGRRPGQDPGLHRRGHA